MWPLSGMYQNAPDASPLTYACPHGSHRRVRGSWPSAMPARTHRASAAGRGAGGTVQVFLTAHRTRQTVLQVGCAALQDASQVRDLGIHNEWICNETYLRKIKEAGIETTTKTGELLIPGDSSYLQEVSGNIHKLEFAMADALCATLK